MSATSPKSPFGQTLEMSETTETTETTARVAEFAALTEPAPFPRVNLMPVEIAQARRLHRTQQVLAGGLAVVMLGLAGGWYVEHRHAGAAAAAVAVEQARSTSLHAQEARYAEVPTVLAEVDRLQLARAHAMAGDVLWYQIIDDISRQAPAGVWVTSLSISTAAATSGTTATTTSSDVGGGDPLAKPAMATITFNVSSLDPDGVGAWLDALTRVPGLSDARYTLESTASTNGRPITTFTSTVGVLSTVLSHRFDQGKA